MSTIMYGGDVGGRAAAGEHVLGDADAHGAQRLDACLGLSSGGREGS